MASLSPDTIRDQAKDLPALSSAALVLLGQIGNPEITREELSYLVSVDQVLCAHAYKYANSAAMGARRELLTIPEIVDYLGMQTLKHIAIFVAAKSFIQDTSMWFESIFIANGSKKLVELYGGDTKTQEIIYAAALFQSYGQIILKTHHTKEFNGLKTIKDFYERLKREKEIFKFNHIEISAMVLPQLEMPREIISMIESQADIESKDFSKVNCVIELSRALLDMEVLEDEELQERLMNHRIAPLCKKFNLDLSKINSDFVKKLFKEADELVTL